MKKGVKPKPLRFNEVLALVKQGLTIKEAILRCGFKATTGYYKRITPEQKRKLGETKLLNSKHCSFLGKEITLFRGEESF